VFVFFFFFKQKTAYEIVCGDWSSDVCSSDLANIDPCVGFEPSADGCQNLERRSVKHKA